MGRLVSDGGPVMTRNVVLGLFAKVSQRISTPMLPVVARRGDTE